MGLMKNLAMERRSPVATAPNSDKECLWISVDGLREIVPISAYPVKSEFVRKIHIDGQIYWLRRKPNGDLIAIKGKAKATTTTPPILRSPLRERFAEYFHHRYDAILNQSGQGWKTIKHPLDEGQIWKAWQDGDRLIGLGFGKTTRYALVDIDADSPYHNEEGLRDIRWALENVGIFDTVLKQSSYSLGWHLYFAFSEAVPTFGLSCLLHRAMEEAGLIIAKGTLEIFPNRKGWQKDAVTTYNRHRLPLQPASGSTLLDADFCPYSTDLGTFLDRLDETAIANDTELIKELAEEARRNYNPSKRGNANGGPFTPHNPNARKWKRNLEEAIATGWNGHHQSNILLGQTAEYGRVFLGYDCEYQLANYIATTAITAPGFIPHCRHAKEINAWALRWARSAIRHRYPYGSRKDGQFKPLGKGGLTNEERRADAMTRIADAVNDFQESGREWPKTIHARRKLLAGMAHCSEGTLIKKDYLPLWHPNHMAIADQDADADDISCNADAVRDSASQDNAGSHPDNNCVMFLACPIPFPRSSSLAECSTSLGVFDSCTTPSAPSTIEAPQSHTESEIQPLEVIMNVPKKEKPNGKPRIRVVNRPKLAIADPNPAGLKPGDWAVEPDRRHILLRIQEIDADGEWCRCQDAGQRRRGKRGGLYLLSELIPAPMAIADEDAHTTTPPEEQT